MVLSLSTFWISDLDSALFISQCSTIGLSGKLCDNIISRFGNISSKPSAKSLNLNCSIPSDNVILKLDLRYLNGAKWLGQRPQVRHT